jgi:hypothetical protein
VHRGQRRKTLGGGDHDRRRSPWPAEPSRPEEETAARGALKARGGDCSGAPARTRPRLEVLPFAPTPGRRSPQRSSHSHPPAVGGDRGGAPTRPQASTNRAYGGAPACPRAPAGAARGWQRPHRSNRPLLLASKKTG